MNLTFVSSNQNLDRILSEGMMNRLPIKSQHHLTETFYLTSTCLPDTAQFISARMSIKGI